MKFLVLPLLQTDSPAWTAALLLATGCVAQAQPSQPAASAGSERQWAPFPLEPVFRIKEAAGKYRFVTRQEVNFEKLKPQFTGSAFLAVVTNGWPTGLVPIFAVEKSQRIELRRRSLSGEENTSEPLFFALPPDDEPDATRIAGRWECRATRADSKNFLVWELTVEMEKISGRFDQGTEYRVAYVVGGMFRSNRLDLRVEYLQDKYVLVGDWREGKLNGDWHRTDDEERGTWEATREPGAPPPRGELVALYEWRRLSDNARHYAVEGEKMTADWERPTRPLCRDQHDCTLLRASFIKKD